jgi:hypothetical protein
VTLGFGYHRNNLRTDEFAYTLEHFGSISTGELAELFVLFGPQFHHGFNEFCGWATEFVEPNVVDLVGR